MVSSKALMNIISLIISVSIHVYVLQAPDLAKIDHGIDSQSFQNDDIDCESACDARCSESKRAKICKRACGTCCSRCGCVPPGTSGHQDVCPCYANMTTHGGRHKCP